MLSLGIGLTKAVCAKKLLQNHRLWKWQCQQLGNPKPPMSHTIMQQSMLFTLKQKDPVEPEEASKSQASHTALFCLYKNTSWPSLCTITTSKERSRSICHRHWNGTPKSTNIWSEFAANMTYCIWKRSICTDYGIGDVSWTPPRQWGCDFWMNTWTSAVALANLSQRLNKSITMLPVW